MSHSLLSDRTARIPFAVLGIFLLLGSSMTCAFILHLEATQTTPAAELLDLNSVSRLTHAAEADIATALNRAGAQALARIGREPIIISSLGSAQDMLTWRLRHALTQNITSYLLAQYTDDQYTDGTYTLNICLSNDTLTIDPDTITFEERTLDLHRQTLPLLGPRPLVSYPSYLIVHLPLTFRVSALSDPDITLRREQATITTLLTSRYLLLEHLTDEFQTTLSGPASPLWAFTTTFANLYSTLRAWKHYVTGAPANIVDNRHLALIANAGILLEQGLVFHSVDPISIITLLSQTGHALNQDDAPLLQYFNQERTPNGSTYNTRNLTQGSANIDAGDNLTDPIETGPLLSFSDIIADILYNITSVTLEFTKPPNLVEYEEVAYTNETSDQIAAMISIRHEQGWTLSNLTKQYILNETTNHAIQSLAASVYRDSMSMVVSNRTVIYTQTNTPGPPWEEGDIGPWHVCLCQPGAKCSTIPLKGDIIPGSSLYQEHYNVTYERTHCWWQDIDVNLSGNHTVIRIWDNRTDTMIESVSLDTLLQWAASFGGTHDDVTDILYENDTLQDPNLQETLDTYRGQHPDSQPEKQQLITTLGNTGATGLQTEIPGLIPQWVQTTSWEAFEDIWDNLSQLTLNHGCNATQYPYPLTLLDHTIANLSALFTAHIQENLAYDRYHPGQRFCSVGMKAVFHARAWLLDSINTSLINTAATLHAALTQILEAAIPASSGYTADSIEETITHTIDALRDKFTIPYGTPMILANPQSPTWTESVLLAVNQIPHVLDPFQPISSGQEQLWTLKLRNRCIFGPTGRPILPLTPVTPWILTMNLWCIDVEGEFLRFEVDDANNEAVYNPLIGHSPQPYVREACVITNGSTILGENTRLHFAYSTISLAVVPAFGMMCGDLQPNWANDATPGYS